jgi:hypothetical protein
VPVVLRQHFAESSLFIIRTAQNYWISCKNMAQYCSGTFVWATQKQQCSQNSIAQRTCASGAQATLCRKFIVYYKNCLKLLDFLQKHGPVLLRHIRLGHTEAAELTEHVPVVLRQHFA